MTALLLVCLTLLVWVGAPLLALALAAVNVAARYRRGEPLWTA